MGVLVTAALLILLQLATLWQAARLQDSLSLATAPLMQKNQEECFGPSNAGCIDVFPSEAAALRAALATPGTWQPYEDGILYYVMFDPGDNATATTGRACYTFRKGDAEHPEVQLIKSCFR
jgi:hypothetical protein